MSWRRIPMKFPGTCIVCNEKIAVNEMGLWAKGMGVKHEKCANQNQIKCIICNGPAGCTSCEFQDICDVEKVSPICICKKCEEQKNNYESYQVHVSQKFPMLSLKS